VTVVVTNMTQEEWESVMPERGEYIKFE